MDKTERLLQMTEHPELYTDTQWQELLSDEECRKLYEAMRLSVSAFEAEDAKQKIANGIKEEEWKKHEAEYFGSEKPHSSLFTFHSSLQKIAAMFIGVLMLSGIAYAAVQIVRHNKVGGDLQSQTQEVRTSNSPRQQGEAQPADSTAQPRLYDNVPLGEILDELSTYYNIKVVYYTEDARHPRLYYQWKPEYTIEKVVEMLNNFEWLQMRLENDTLYVKSTAIPANDC